MYPVNGIGVNRLNGEIILVRVILQRFPTARKTSVNPECLRVVPPALAQKFIEQAP